MEFQFRCPGGRLYHDRLGQHHQLPNQQFDTQKDTKTWRTGGGIGLISYQHQIMPHRKAMIEPSQQHSLEGLVYSIHVEYNGQTFGIQFCEQSSIIVSFLNYFAGMSSGISDLLMGRRFPLVVRFLDPAASKSNGRVAPQGLCDRQPGRWTRSPAICLYPWDCWRQKLGSRREVAYPCVSKDGSEQIMFSMSILIKASVLRWFPVISIIAQDQMCCMFWSHNIKLQLIFLFKGIGWYHIKPLITCSWEPEVCYCCATLSSWVASQVEQLQLASTSPVRLPI